MRYYFHWRQGYNRIPVEIHGIVYLSSGNEFFHQHGLALRECIVYGRCKITGGLHLGHAETAPVVRRLDEQWKAQPRYCILGSTFISRMQENIICQTAYTGSAQMVLR